MQNMGFEVLFRGTNFLRLCGGLWVTLRIALISMILSILLGFVLGMIMNIQNIVVKAICRFYLEVVRIMPQLVLLFLVYFGAAKHLGMNLSGENAAIIVFTFWGTAEMGDLVRSALIAIPKHQYESGCGLCFLRGEHGKGRGSRHGGGLCHGRTARYFQQQRKPLDSRCANGSA